MNNDQGEPATTHQEVQEILGSYFGEMEAGVHVSSSDFEFMALSQQRTQEEGSKEVSLSPEVVPAPADLARLFRKVRVCQGLGEEQIPPELLKLTVTSSAHFWHSLFAKSVLRIREPIAWSGGLLYALFKGAGATNERTNYRAILLSSQLGKALHRSMRGCLTPYLQQFAVATQLGGIAGGGTDLVAQVSRLYLHAVKAGKRNGGILFCDVASAFYRVVRELIIPAMVTATDGALCWLFQTLRVPPESLHQLQRGRRQRLSMLREYRRT
jgi:hypothetical protein